MKKLSILLLTVLSGLTCITSCIKEDPNAKKVYVLIPSSETAARWDKDNRYLHEAFASYDIELTVLSFNETTQSSLQVEELQKAVSSGIRNFIITPIDYSAINDSKVFDGQNLNIVCHDRMIYNNAAVDCFSSCDCGEVGELQGNYVVGEYLASGKDKMTMEILSGPTSDNNSTLLFNGVEKVLKTYLSNGSLEVPSGKKTFIETSLPSWGAGDAKNEVSERLKTYYNDGAVPDIIICPNDDCAAAAVLAIYEYNPKLTAYPIIVGQDNTSEAQELIKKGTMSMTVDKSIRDMSYNSAMTLVNLMRGIEPTTSKFFDNGIRYVPYIKATPEEITVGSLL